MEWMKSPGEIVPMCQRHCASYVACLDKYACSIKVCISKGCDEYSCIILIG